MSRAASLGAVPLLTITLSGCDSIAFWKDRVEGLTEPLVIQGLVLGIESPESDSIDLSSSDYSEGTTATMFLADAASADELEQAPVEGAALTVADVDATDAGGGTYNIEIGPLTYMAGEVWPVEATYGDEARLANVELPEPADVTVPQNHTANTEIEVDFTDMGFHSALIVVLDGATGDITWSNEPKDVGEYYDFTHGADVVSTMTIPAEAFPTAESVYAVGISGLIHTTSDDLTGFNTALSTVMAGKMKFYPVSTLTVPTE